MRLEDPIIVAYAFHNGTHAFTAEDPRVGPLRVVHGVPELAYQEVTQTLSARLGTALGQPLKADPRLPFRDFWTWLQMNPMAAMPDAPCRVELAWELRG